MKSNYRDVSKFLEEAKNLKEKAKYKVMLIYSSEMEQLYNLSVHKDRLDIALLCWNSYAFGFIAGLHYAKNQQKKRRKKLAQ